MTTMRIRRIPEGGATVNSEKSGSGLFLPVLVSLLVVLVVVVVIVVVLVLVVV